MNKHISVVSVDCMASHPNCPPTSTQCDVIVDPSVHPVRATINLSQPTVKLKRSRLFPQSAMVSIPLEGKWPCLSPAAPASEWSSPLSHQFLPHLWHFLSLELFASLSEQGWSLHEMLPFVMAQTFRMPSMKLSD